MDLPLVWFVAVAVLWTGYLVLEGFDFGVGVLLPALSRGEHREADRRVVLGAIGPVWDGNEVWLITAVGAMFAAFPVWYSATLSGFYLPVLAVLVALIVRGVALEYRGKRPDPAWRRRCDAAIVAGSAVPAFVWGLVFANLLRGVELGADGVVTSSLPDLLSPVALLGGAAALAVCTAHGAVFLALKTDGPVRHRARTAVRVVGPVAVLLLGGVAVALGGPLAAAGAAALAAGVLLAARGREGWGFAATAVAIAATTAAVFTAMHPVLLPSLTDPAASLTVANAASGPYTLGVLSVVGAVALPVVIGYQAWSYWVFRRRVTRDDVPEHA